MITKNGLQKTHRRPNKSNTTDPIHRCKINHKVVRISVDSTTRNTEQTRTSKRNIRFIINTRKTTRTKPRTPTRIKILQNVWKWLKRFLHTVLPHFLWHTCQWPKANPTENMGPHPNRPKPILTPHKKKKTQPMDTHKLQFNIAAETYYPITTDHQNICTDWKKCQMPYSWKSHSLGYTHLLWNDFTEETNNNWTTYCIYLSATNPHINAKATATDLQNNTNTLKIKSIVKNEQETHEKIIQLQEQIQRMQDILLKTPEIIQPTEPIPIPTQPTKPILTTPTTETPPTTITHPITRTSQRHTRQNTPEHPRHTKKNKQNIAQTKTTNNEHHDSILAPSRAIQHNSLTHCRLNRLSHTIYWKTPISILGTSGYEIYIFLEKNG